MFACSKLGAYYTLFNYAYSPSELVNALAATTPKVLLTTLRTSRYDYSTVLAGLQGDAYTKNVVILKDVSERVALKPASHPFLDYDDITSAKGLGSEDILLAESEVHPLDILNLQFTSGSTGLPKAAALTHHGMVNSARYIGDQMNVGEKDRINVPVPLFHAFGLIMGMSRVIIVNTSSYRYRSMQCCSPRRFHRSPVRVLRRICYTACCRAISMHRLVWSHDNVC
jgi:acyl-CoA synthetase (AMP-forming)/AMP-acid ligase II